MGFWRRRVSTDYVQKDPESPPTVPLISDIKMLRLPSNFAAPKVLTLQMEKYTVWKYFEVSPLFAGSRGSQREYSLQPVQDASITKKSDHASRGSPRNICTKLDCKTRKGCKYFCHKYSTAEKNAVILIPSSSKIFQAQLIALKRKC